MAIKYRNIRGSFKLAYFSLIFSFLIFSNSECEDKVFEGPGQLVWIKNESSLRIYASPGINYDCSNIYPDTSLPKSIPCKREVLPDKKRELTSKVDALFDQTLSSDTLSIYIFNADSLDNLGWPKIRDEYKVLERYDLSYEDLKKRNFVVKYP